MSDEKSNVRPVFFHRLKEPHVLFVRRLQVGEVFEPGPWRSLPIEDHDINVTIHNPAKERDNG